LLDGRPGIAVLLAQQFPVQGLDPVHLDEHGGAGAGIAVMLAQVQRQFRATDLRVERHTGLEAMLPLLLEAEEIEIELLGLGNVEDADDRNAGVESDRTAGHPFGPFAASTSFSSASTR